MVGKGTFGTSAYGGEGWTPRTSSHREEIGGVWAASGIDSEWAPLKQVLLHAPGDELSASKDPAAVQMLAPLDLGLARDQHAAMRAAYEAAGVIVHAVEPSAPARPNQMFVADLLFATPEGVILARPASTIRAGEERQVARRLADLGVPILATLTGTATFEGADAMWLDPGTVVIGKGLRTNGEGVEQVARLLDGIGVEIRVVDLPYGTMHLMGLLRIADADLAVAWPRRTPHAAVAALRERGVEVLFLPETDEAEMNLGINFVTLAPRRILMAAGCAAVQAVYEKHGIECLLVEVGELAKAAGAIGCLTGVLERERAGGEG